MRNLYLLLLATCLIEAYPSEGQTAFPYINYVDINHIKAAALVHGDLWWNPTQQVASCEFPKSSGKHIQFASSLWLSGFDAGNNLHVAAQTYRQTGNDYWPGPLDNNDTLTYATSQSWAYIWKINQSDINAFNALTTHTAANTPTDILRWPAKGNPYAQGAGSNLLNINQDMAPFVDVNADGVYNALQGDYPAIKGDQTLFWVFSDNGPTHTETNGAPFKVEIHAMAYAYSRGTMVDNMVFYEYQIINKSNINYQQFRVGLFSDADLGYFADDYIGFDSSHRMGIEYNSVSPDGMGQANYYGTHIPITGVTLLHLPGDAPANYVPAGNFRYYNNDNTVMGNPNSPINYNQYLRGMWRDSTSVTNDFAGYGVPSTCYGSGSSCNYVYTGNPADTSQWSECASQNPIGDRRYIINSGDFSFNAGSSETLGFALITTFPDSNNTCPNVSFDSIIIYADTAWAIYRNSLPTAVSMLAANNAAPLIAYPNPCGNELCIPLQDAGAYTYRVFNTLGQNYELAATLKGAVLSFNTGSLPSGLYYVQIMANKQYRRCSFVKQ